MSGLPANAAEASPEEASYEVKLLDAASGFLEAQDALAASQAREQSLSMRVDLTRTKVDGLRKDLAPLDAEVDRARRAVSRAAPNDFSAFVPIVADLSAATTRREQRAKELTVATADLREAESAVRTESANQRAQDDALERNREKLEIVGATSVKTKVAARNPGYVAKPVKRTKNGKLPRQSCSRNDPTTKSCVSSRTLNAYNEARRAGFTRYTKCHGPGSVRLSQHPAGKACDFSVKAGGFGGNAKGDNRVYGNQLAQFFIKNARALGVRYIIWYKRIWKPSTGWRHYSRAVSRNDPGRNHTNHVHLSMF